MRGFKSSVRLAVVALVAAVAMIGFAPTPASAEPTGQYYYYCIGSNGVSYTWNSKGYTCNGWWDVYINGNRVAHVKESKAYAKWLLNPGGKPVVSTDCFVTGALLYLAILAEPIGWAGLAFGLIGTGYACR